MSDPKPSFVHVSYIASTADKVFAALTDGKFTQEYWAGRVVESDWKKGSPVRFFRRGGGEDYSVRGVVLEHDPPSLLSYTWEHMAPGAPRTPATRVTFTLKQVTPNNVRLQVVHEAHEPGSELRDEVREGWSAILSSLKSYLETGRPLEATQRWESEQR
ncbi:MAG TPA: SRPBCC family protein [Polyangia bacterium]